MNGICKRSRRTAPWRLASLLLMLFALLAAGCMTERSPIDQTNPQALDKRLFEGEFFYKQTIVDIPYTVDYSFIGETNSLKIIRWEITESALIGYNVHENKETVDTNGVRDMAKTPVVAYPILDHFDIQLAQNSTTGEDMPIMVEVRDNPWWQRRYFVIDASNNMVNKFDFDYLRITIDWENPFNVTPIALYDNLEFTDKLGMAIDPKNYEMRHMAGGDQLVNTFSFHTELVLTANNSWRNIYSWSDVVEFINWEAARFKMRHFFWKVDRDSLASNGFEPMEFQDDMFRRFGFFTREYRAIDPQHGYRENNTHMWANYYNIEGDNKIVYYLGPNFPERLALTACSIGADYNWAFSKVYYEGRQARLAADEGGVFVTDFPDQVKLADGLYQIGMEGAAESSLFMPDATEPWPENLKLDDSKYYYLDYTIESMAAPADWREDEDGANIDEFNSRRSAMVKEMKRYCFNENSTDKFQLRRNEFLSYSFVREGVNPEGLPNMITPEEIVEIYGDDINDRVARPVDYAVACRLTAEHRCELDAEGNKVARWKFELGDPRVSMLYWVDKPTEYGILGVAQWSDNPETGQIFGGVGHIAGSVLQWSVSRELERYFMIDALKEEGFNPTSSRYKELLDDLIIDAEYASLPQAGEEDRRVQDEPNPSPPFFKSANKSAPAVGSEGWNMVQQARDLIGRKPAELANMKSKLDVQAQGVTNAEELAYLKEKHLPTWTGNVSLAAIKGTKWEHLMAPHGFLTYIYPDQTSFTEDMLYQISPMYWGTQDAMSENIEREIKFTTGCYFQSEWLDGGFLEIIKKLDDLGLSREQIRGYVERVMFKGVAEHELGHALGLRHNFNGSADELNYVGNKAQKTGYWAFKDQAKADLDQAIKDFVSENKRQPTPWEKHYLEKSLASPKDWYMYSSVMDYMDEFYFHGFGLGVYDVSAFRYVYGKAIEKYSTVAEVDARNKQSDNFRAGHDFATPVAGVDRQDNWVATSNNDPVVTIEPLFEKRYCTKNDIYNQACSCVLGSPEEGYSDDDCICDQDKGGMTYCFNPNKEVDGLLRYEAPVKLVADSAGNLNMEPVEAEEAVAIQLNGDVKPYLYCPDNWRWDDPMCNVWDKGYTARDVVRNMVDSYKRFYFWRFFRRGNPRFRRTSWWGSIQRFTGFAHFALDLNYNFFQLPDWMPAMTGQETEPFPTDGNGEAVAIPLARKEYLLAQNGLEEWEEYVYNDREPNEDERWKKVTKTFVPLGVGDYAIAAMEGFNFLVYDVLYSADVGAHVSNSWKDDSTVSYYEKNPYIYDDDELDDTVGGPVVDVDLRYGHYHKNHWDRQDDLGITQSKLMVRGFTTEKDAAMFVLANTGWWMEKYRMESMANGYAYLHDGFDNAIYHVMSDQLNENALFSLSTNCVYEVPNGNKTEYKLKKFLPRTTELFHWNLSDLWSEQDQDYDTDGLDDTVPNKWHPRASDPTKSLCQKATEDEKAAYDKAVAAAAAKGEEYDGPLPNIYTPVHGSWVYFDSMFPAFWAMYNQANTMADNMVYEYYYARSIPVGEYDQWESIDDDINAVECLNTKESIYYRAYKFEGDDRDNPIYNMVKRCKNIQELCLVDESQGMVPGNFVGLNDVCGNSGFPRYYLNRELEYIESKILLLRSYGNFWIDSANLFF